MPMPLNQRVRLAGHLGLRGPERPLFRHSARSIDPLDQLERFADLGFAGVQDNFLKLRPPAEQARMGRRMADLGLDLGCFANDPAEWNLPLWNGDDPAAAAMLRRNVESSIAAAARVGGGDAVCVTGYDPSRPRGVQIAAMIDNLRRFAEPARKGGLRLLVEPVADLWVPGLLVNNLADATAMVRAVDSPSVRLLFDVAHVRMTGEEIVPALAGCWDIVGGIQAADVPDRTDLGTGELDWPAILGWIADRGYTGLVEIEHEPAEDSMEGETRLVERLRRIDAMMHGAAAR